MKQVPKPGTPQYSSFEFKIGPNIHLTDGATWRFRSDIDYFSDPQEWIGVIPCSGEPFIMSPIISYEGGGAKHPVWGGVLVIKPNGDMKRYSPQEAIKNPELVKTGHLFPEKIARQIAGSYRYLHGSHNQYKGVLGMRKGDHKDRYEVFDDGDNSQPYLLQGADNQPYWVTMMKPYKSGQALGAIMYTNAITGKTTIWYAPEGSSLIGNQRALDVADSFAISGVNYGEGVYILRNLDHVIDISSL